MTDKPTKEGTKIPQSKEQQRGGFGMVPTTFVLGEELVAIVRLLSAINTNLAVIARCQQCLVMPELKDKLFKKAEEPKDAGQDNP